MIIASTAGGGPGGGIILGGPVGQADGCCIGMHRPGGGVIGSTHTGFSFLTLQGFVSADDPGP